MCKKLFFLISFVLVLGIVGSASADPVPAPWADQFIGADDPLDSGADWNPGTQTLVVTGGGHDIWDDNDDFHYVYTPWSGDCDLICRVTSFPTGVNNWSKGGVMVRQNLTDGSVYALTAMVGNEGNGCVLQSRPTANSNAALGDLRAPGTFVEEPEYIRMTRTGDLFRGYFSENGTDWTEIGTGLTVVMTGDVLIGFAVTSHDTTSTVTATFDNFGGDIVWVDPNAKNPAPANNSTGVPIDTDICWTPGDGAVMHEVYFGTDPAPPYQATQMLGNDCWTPPEDLVASTTYYWQIAEVNGLDTYYGPVWNFETIRGEAQVNQPEDGEIIPGAMYGGNIYAAMYFYEGPTAVEHVCYFSDDYLEVESRVEDANFGPPYDTGQFFAGLLVVDPLAESLVRGETYYWTVDAIDARGNKFEGDIWSFIVQDYYAFLPNPLDGAIFVDTDVVLSWETGFPPASTETFQHDVYLGTSLSAVSDADANDTTGIYLGYVDLAANWPCSGLEVDTTYYWRVDEVHSRIIGLGGIYYYGDVWSFTTRGPISGLVGEYYHWFDGIARGGGDPGPDDPFQSKMLVRVDPNINFNWDTGAPDPTMDIDNFSVRWTGQIAVPSVGTYTFTTETDDGVRLWINDTQIIDQWVDQGVTAHSGSIQLTSFGPHDIRIEYYENGGGAAAMLNWEGPSAPYGIVPSNYLAPTNLAAFTAAGPYPRDGSSILPDENLEFKPTLSWAPGLFSSTHELYFSTSFDDVNERTAPMIPVSDPCYTTGLLDMDQTYYWCIDESNSLGPAPGDWPGDVWSFTPISTGYVNHEWWTGIGGVLIPDLTGNANYPDNPTGSDLLTTFEGPVDWMDDYGSRIHGWLRPKISGNYRFWIATDDGGELWLSTDEDPCNAVLISWIATGAWAASRQWYDADVVASSPIALKGTGKYYISALMKEAGGGDNIAVAWQGPAQPNPPVAGDAGAIIDGQFLSATPYDPPYATVPNPADGATVEDRTPALEWWPGSYVQVDNGPGAGRHQVYFSDNFADVNDRSIAHVELIDPCHPITTLLDLGRTYYWAVDEVNSAGPAPYKWWGRVWSFTMSECMSLDNMEDYNDRVELRRVWRDGYADVVWGGQPPNQYLIRGGSSGSNLNVSTAVGSPFPAVTGPVRSFEAMAFYYENDGNTFPQLPGEEKWVYDVPNYSEIEANTVENLGVGQNWPAEGVKAFTLWFQGHPLSDGGLDTTGWPGFYTQSGRGRDIWGRHDEFYYAAKYPLTGAITIEVDVFDMENTDPWAKAGLMIREKWTPYSKYAGVFMTPGNGVTFQWRMNEDGPSSSISKPGVVPPQRLKLERTLSGAFIAKHSSDGYVWEDVNDTTEPASPTIAMGLDDPSIYAGTAVTSHDALVTCTADLGTFEITPFIVPWVVGDIGTNDPEQLYVALSDGVTTSVIEHPDPNAATLTDWQEWNIELTEFGVNLNNVRKVYIGMGDRDTHPDAGGKGAIYIDDVRACPPRCVPSLAKPDADIAVPYDCVVDEKDLRVMAGDWLLSDRIITTSAPNPANLLAIWEFEGNWNDTSGYAHHASDPCGSNPGFASGVIGQALSLNGVDQYLVVDSNVGVDGNMPKTIACWAKADHTNIPDWTLIFGFTGTNPVNNSHFNIGSLGGPGGVGAHVWGWEETIFSDTEALDWHHYAMTYDGSRIDYFGDGVWMDTSPDTPQVRNLINDDQVHFGKRGTQDTYFPGKVDDARIYDYPLSEGEIAYLATQGALTLHVPIPSDADLYDKEQLGSQWINLKDYGVMTNSWLEKVLWP